uniref:NADH-ubiquinone oxidoreductase chain 5 n=1 Tax=Nacolus tuberculatus TaxID=2800230 RepID=A0A7T6YCR5_9HEMI|nr:NADH dehydrogenase subunit 5 [Nacolus tuberculatus]QQK57716.1 NADH dehydrogenase subunit 5 [Nacolus tuberculatus]
MFNYKYMVWFYIIFFFSLLFFFFGLYFILFDYSLMMEWEFFSLHSVSIFYILLFDWFSLFFLSVIMFISSMVIVYSMSYVGYYNFMCFRFLVLVILFIVSMLLMVLSPNLVSILLGWDGLGIISYCLIIYYNSINSYLSGMLTCLINRLGDIGLLISISWIFCFGSWNFIYFNDFYAYGLYNLIFISCFTKSAQIPFSCWLPAAMAAPTPVSALVHSSTLVTAGVYLLIRFYNLNFYNNYLFLFISVMTMFFSSICAMLEFDLSKIIAFSTLSQLGLMMSSLYCGLPIFSYYHMLSHAMFSSLLFLCSGVFIYYMGNNQDIRFMGSVCFFLPMTSSCFLISIMALCGIPFLSGFYSSDLIIDFSSFYSLSLFFFSLYYLSLGMTSFYSMRLFYYSMFSNLSSFSFSCVLDFPDKMKFTIFFLSIFSILFGCFFSWLMNLNSFILLPLSLKLFSFFFVFLGFWFGYEFYKFNYFNLYFCYFNGFMWFINGFYIFIYFLFYNFSFGCNYFLMWGEYYGGNSFFYFFKCSFNFLQYYTNNSLKIFLISFFLWFIIFI